MCSWKFNCILIPFLGKCFNLWTPWISQSYRTCYFIEGFSCCIISCSSYYFKLTIIINFNKMGMST